MVFETLEPLAMMPREWEVSNCEDLNCMKYIRSVAVSSSYEILSLSY